MALALLIGLILLWAYSDRLFPPERIDGAVVHVRDGDTFDMNGRTIRLAGIDAPEYRQTCTAADGSDWPCGRAARSALEALIVQGRVTCEVVTTDQYRRTIARCATASVADIGQALVQGGMATSPAMRGTAAYAEAEEIARDAKRGIWQGEFEPPVEWRAAHLAAHD